jgi:hypothetical protein
MSKPYGENANSGYGPHANDRGYGPDAADRDDVRAVNLEMPESLIAAIDETARREGMKRAALVRSVMGRYVKGRLVDAAALAILAGEGPNRHF